MNAKTGKGDYQISLALGANGGKGGSTGNASIDIEDAIITTQVHHPVPFKSKPSAVEVATLAM